MASQYDGTIRINTNVDQSGVQRGLSGITSAVKKVGIAVAAAFSVRAIVNFSKACIELGSDLEEVQNVVDVTFGKMSGAINEFAIQAAEKIGISELAAKQYTSTLGAMYKSMGFSEDAAAGMSMKMTELAADMASFYNLDADTAFQKIRSGISGETEPLKQLGINLSEANLEQFRLAQGIQTSYKNMDQQSKALLRYNYLLSVTSDAQGDFARTSGSWANQTKVLNLQLQSIKANLGQGLINVLTPALRVINRMLAALAKLASAFKAFTALITGNRGTDTSTSVATDTADAYDAVADSYSDSADAATDYADATTDAAQATKKAAKEAQKYLSPLDQIYRYTTETADALADTPSGGTSTPAGVGAGITPSEVASVDFGSLAQGETVVDKLSDSLQAVIDRVKELAGLFMTGFKLGAQNVNLEPLRSALSSIGQTMTDIFSSERVQAAANNYMNTLAWSLGAQAGALYSVGVSLATNVVGGLAQALSENKERIIEWIASMFDLGARWETIKANFQVAVANVFSVIGGENATTATANILGIFLNASMGVTQLAAQFGVDVLDALTKPFIDNQDAIRAALDGVFGIFAGVLGSIQTLVKNVVDQALAVYSEYISPLLQSIGTGLSQLVATAMDMWNTYILPVLENLGEKVQFCLDNYLAPFASTVLSLVGKIANLVQVLWENVLVPTFEWIMQTVAPVLAPLIQLIGDTFITHWQLIMTAIDSFLILAGGVIDFLTNVFEGDWKAAWESIKKAAIAAWSRLQTGVQTPFNAIKLKIQNAWEAIQTKTGEIWGFISSALGSLWEGIKTKAGTVWGAITKALRDTWDGIKSTAIEKFNSIKANIYNAWSYLKTKAESIWASIKSFIVTPVQDIWDKVTEAATGIKDEFYGAFNSLVGLVKTPLNGIIGFLNYIIDTIENVQHRIADALTFSIELPGWMQRMTGYSSFGFSMPYHYYSRIPYLAQGAVIPPNAPFMAMLGDQTNGRNLELPEDLLRQVVREESGSGSTPIHVHLYLKGRQIYEAVIDEAKSQRQMSGRNPFEFA